MPKTKQTIPAFNPADLSSQEGIFTVLKKTVMQDLYVCVPAVIVSFDRSANRAKVQPALYAKSTDGEQIAFPEVSNVPVHTPGGGGFAASFPLSAGDTGWLLVADRDISLFKQELGLVLPNTYRSHSLEDGFFIPDVFQKISVSAEDMSAAVWQTLDGSVKVALSSSGLTVTAQTENRGDVTIKGNLTVTGNITATGNVTAANVSASGDVSAGGISLKAHVHGGVQGGQGTTGPAQ